MEAGSGPGRDPGLLLIEESVPWLGRFVQSEERNQRFWILVRAQERHGFLEVGLGLGRGTGFCYFDYLRRVNCGLEVGLGQGEDSELLNT